MAVLNASKRKTATSGFGQQTKFGMDLNAKSYEILMEGLYEEPIRAMVREMTCNMNDSHVLRDRLWHTHTAPSTVQPSHYQSVYTETVRSAAKNDSELVERLKTLNTPDVHYEVQMPSDISPHIIFQDHGVGLHINDIVGERHWDEVIEDGEIVNQYTGRHGGLFTTLFRSTKEDSNDFIGALGLGCKTPYALSPTFTMKSVHKGRVHHYLGMKDEDGIPTCICTSERIDGETGESENPDGDPIDEKDGITITIPCPSDKFRAITQFAMELFRVFEKPPVVHGGSYEPVDFDRSQQVASTYIQKGRYGGFRHYALMGNVAYPIRTDFLPDEAENLLDQFGGSSYTVFPIGALDFQPSRDGLNYNDRTCEALRVYFNNLTSLVVDRYRAELSRAAKMGQFAAWDKLVELKETFGDNFVNMLDVKRKGDKLGSKTPMNVKLGMHDFSVKCADGSVKEYSDYIAELVGCVNTRNRNVVRYASRLVTSFGYGMLKNMERNGSKIYIVTKPEGTKFWRRRYERLFEELRQPGDEFYQTKWNSKLEYKPDLRKKLLVNMHQYADLVEFIDLSTIEPMPTRASIMKSRSGASGERSETPNVLLWHGGTASSEGWIKVLKAEYEDIEEGAYYVDVQRWEMQGIGNGVFNLLRDVYDIDKLYGIRKAGRKQIKENNLKPVVDLLPKLKKCYLKVNDNVARFKAVEYIIDRNRSSFDGKQIAQMKNKWADTFSNRDLELFREFACKAGSLRQAGVECPAYDLYSTLIQDVGTKTQTVTIRETTFQGEHLEELGLSGRSIQVEGAYGRNMDEAFDVARAKVKVFKPSPSDVQASSKFLEERNLKKFTTAPRVRTYPPVPVTQGAANWSYKGFDIAGVEHYKSWGRPGAHDHVSKQWFYRDCDLYWVRMEHDEHMKISEHWCTLGGRRFVRLPFYRQHAGKRVESVDPIYRFHPNRFQTLVA